MTEEQHQQYRSELNTPYSIDELGDRLTDRDAKSLLEITHAHNFDLIRLVKKWSDFVAGKAPRPERNLWKFLVPGNNGENAACDRLNQLVEYYSQFDYGTAKPFPIAFFCSRSTMTLLSYLENLYSTPHLDTAERAAKDFFTLITGELNSPLGRDSYKRLLRKSVDDFIASCEANARELHQYLLSFITGKRPRTATDTRDSKIIAEVRDDGKATRKHITNSTRTIISEVKKATNEFNEGCHHPDKDKDKLVQEVIKYLARPGVVFSINNACCKIAGKSRPGRCKLPWLYDWCHDHQTEIKDAVDILRPLNQKVS